MHDLIPPTQHAAGMEAPRDEQEKPKPGASASRQGNPRSRRRVLLLADSPYFGGITSHLAMIARAFSGSSEFECVLATFEGRRDDETLMSLADQLGFPVHTIPMPSAFDIRVVRELRRFLADAHIDLVHSHNYKANILCALARPPVPVLHTSHGMAVEPGWKLALWQRMDLRIKRRLGSIIACSAFVKDWLVRQGIAANRVRVVHNAYAPPEHGVAPVSRESLGIPEQAVTLLFVGRLAPGKGVHVLLEAASALPWCCVVLVGDGPERTRLEAQAKASRVETRFTGYVQDPAPYYAMADIVVLPSAMEALPMSLIEACAFEKPCIAARSGGTPEVVKEGVNGLLVEYGNVGALRAAVEHCRHAEIRAALGRAGFERWQRHFTPEVMAGRLAEAYHEALASS